MPVEGSSLGRDRCPVVYPCVRLNHLEARGYQLVAEVAYRPLVCRDDHMIELLDDVTIEEVDPAPNGCPTLA